MRHLPFHSAWADLVSAGWAIGHLRSWFADDWQTQIGSVLDEMHRVVAPGGALIILETLSTGSLTPAPPNAALAEYYDWPEQTWGFSRETIRPIIASPVWMRRSRAPSSSSGRSWLRRSARRAGRACPSGRAYGAS